MMALCSGISYSANSTILSAYSEKNRKRKDKAKKPRVDLSKTSYPNLNQTNYIMFSIFKYTCKIHTTIILSKLLQERDKTTNKFIPFFFSEKKTQSRNRVVKPNNASRVSDRPTCLTFCCNKISKNAE